MKLFHPQESVAGFCKAQRLAYQAVTEMERFITEGQTEKQIAQLMEAYLRDHGVKSFFHKPFVWLGDRTKFVGVKNYRDFSPSHRRYHVNDVVLFDVAPIVDGYVGDVGYSFCKTNNSELVQMKKFLLELRNEIPKLFLQFENQGSQLWSTLDQMIKDQGYENIHALYPFSVLGHQVHKIPSWLGRFEIRTPTPFSAHAFWPGLLRGLRSQLLNTRHQKSLKGLWAIEPHLGGKNFGAKFEEILVFDGHKAEWLDDQVPHVQEQKEARVYASKK